MRSSILILWSVVLTIGVPGLQAQNTPPPAQPPPGMRAVRDQDYGGAGNPRQMLDLYLPLKMSDTPRPLVVYIHGGGWSGGHKNDCGILFPLLNLGDYVGASINYRLTNEASWPAQIHDCKAALRWLAAHAKEYNIDTSKIGLVGISAGGHLVSLLGTTHANKELEGAVGTPGVAPKVTCVENFCGPANFLTFGRGGTIDPEDANSAIGKLLGGALAGRQAEAKAASPVNYVSADDPPFLHIHGTKDNLVPYAQAKEFDAALDKAGVSSTLLSGQDGPHVFFSHQLLTVMKAFFEKHLSGGQLEIREGDVAVK